MKSPRVATHRRGWVALAGMLAAMGMILVGCQATPRIAGGEAKAAATDDSAGYLDGLSSAKDVTQEEAFAGILLLLDGKAGEQSFAERVDELMSRRIVAAGWDFDPTRSLTKGQAAYMVYQACREKGLTGGLTLTLTGPSQRYALRELQYRRMMGDGLTYNPISGMEYVALLTRADAFRRTGQVPEILQ